MDDIPKTGTPCATCVDGLAIPFDVKADNAPHPVDDRLGLYSDTVTTDWLFNNKWITSARKEQHARNAFLLKVLEQFGKAYGAEKLAEMRAFLYTDDYQFVCLDDELLIDANVQAPLILRELNSKFVEISNRYKAGKDIAEYQLSDNFLFADSRIFYATFTRARFESNDPSPIMLDWSISGHFDIATAVQALKRRYEAAQASSKRWKRFWGGVEAALAIATVVPIVGQFSAAARGTIAAVRGAKYAFYAIETALTANMLVDGSNKVINGEGLDLGEALFKRIGALADPKDGAQRGAQVFMVVNLLMLAPLAGQAAKWGLIRFPGTSRSMAAYEVAKEIEQAAARYARQGEAAALYINFARTPRGIEATTSSITRIDTRLTPSLDTRNWFHRIEFTGGAAHVNVRTTSLRSTLAMIIHEEGSAFRVAGRVCKIVGDLGEEILAQRLMREYHVKADNILGYSRGKLGLNNASGQGLDILVRVPPPPSLTVRTPTTQAARNGIEGSHGTTKTTTLTFQPDTLLVIELKTTLGGQVTPGLSKATQQGGGEKDLKRIQALIKTGKKGWKSENLQRFDPDFNSKIKEIKKASESGRIEFIHVQVFLGRDGEINSAVGNGSGIQWNSWKA
ncbi:hypothetical protein H8I69_14940 [Serratia fonticola]|uniref:hypothetical protein n=1 Tax=Serratia fonticola TaxID=47917 RepID=UPI0015C67A8F|nr:hypothetical protein [Serratia fonticola]MBC3380411.1 hypothetical protein [Serratia fonticola]NYA39610.1 hypothetical protein [Serratia fonticola]